MSACTSTYPSLSLFFCCLSPPPHTPCVQFSPSQKINRMREARELNPGSTQRRKKSVNKSQEQGLNLNRSWHKATLMRTIPRSSFKSYTKDLSLPIFELVFQHRLTDILLPAKCRHNVMILARRLYVLILHQGSHISPLSSMDSGLEAFSRNPAHGSFSALTFQSTEFANYVNQRFLSY